MSHNLLDRLRFQSLPCRSPNNGSSHSFSSSSFLTLSPILFLFVLSSRFQQLIHSISINNRTSPPVHAGSYASACLWSRNPFWNSLSRSKEKPTECRLLPSFRSASCPVGLEASIACWTLAAALDERSAAINAQKSAREGPRLGLFCLRRFEEGHGLASMLRFRFWGRERRLGSMRIWRP